MHETDSKQQTADSRHQTGSAESMKGKKVLNWDRLDLNEKINHRFITGIISRKQHSKRDRIEVQKQKRSSRYFKQKAAAANFSKTLHRAARSK